MALAKPQKNIIIAIVSLIGIVVISVLTYNYYNPKLRTDGFPVEAKNGDKFTKDGKNYIFNGSIGMWVLQLPIIGRISNDNTIIVNLAKQYDETIKNNDNSEKAKQLRLSINNQISKYGIQWFPIYDKNGVNEYKRIETSFTTLKGTSGGCVTSECCNGNGLRWCKANVCEDKSKGCSGCMTGNCSQCNCTS